MLHWKGTLTGLTASCIPLCYDLCVNNQQEHIWETETGTGLMFPVPIAADNNNLVDLNVKNN